MKKIGYLLFSLGLIIISLNAKITGAVIGGSIESNLGFLFGLILLILGIILIKKGATIDEVVEDGLSKKDKREIIEAFKDWGGKPNKKQRGILKRFGLVYEIGGRHGYIYGEGYRGKQTTTLTPSEPRSNMNLAHQLIRYIENRGSYRDN